MPKRALNYSEQRLVKIIRFTQVAMLLTMINFIFEAVMNTTPIFNPGVIVWALAVCLVEYAIRCIFAQKKSYAFSVFLTVVTCALFISIWTRGGLHSTGIVAVPVIILLSVLYGRTRDVFWLLTAVAAYFIFLGQTSLVSADDASPVLYQIPVVVIVFCIGGYISWAIGDDMRRAFRSLNDETQKLLASEASIQQLSKTDFLTGLVNAKQACKSYDALLDELTIEQQVYFLFIDLDGFKEINDLFDHQAGDKLLVLIADRLSSLVDEKVQVCRLSGDEFIIFYAEDTWHDVSLFAKQLLNKISEPHALFGTPAKITASIGIATTRLHSFNDIRKKASMAMYQSKRESTNGYFLYSEALEAEYMRRVYILQGLNNGVRDGYLALHFQPKVDLKTNKVNGMEALIRWTRGNFRNYSPDEFMEVIESTELVHEIGNWAITEACYACKKWHQAGFMLPVAVNVSAQQLYRTDFAENILQTLSLLDLDGRFLEIELTERFLVEQNESVEKQLATLRNAGVSFSIDDFGTGYSNVSYLMNLEANALKLDKSFIDRLHSNASMSSMIKAIIEIARAGEMKVIAEGIETEADKQAVIELGCDMGQGYYWSKPLDQMAALEMLSSRGIA